MNDQDFLSRIDYKGDIKHLLSKVAADYDFGDYKSHQIIKSGYEDCNIILGTVKGKYFVKIFANFRSKADCERYVSIMIKAISAGINHPKLFESSQGYLHHITNATGEAYLCIMEHIKGESFYDSKTEPNQDEIKFITEQSALINKINLKLDYVYDSWAIPNLLKEYNQIENMIDTNDKVMIEPLINEFKKINFDLLPHAFVHGDLIKTNILKDENGKLYVIDFSVANYYPRLQELAILLCNFCFDPNNLSKYKDMYDLVLKTYQEAIPLEKIELDLMPLFVKLAHAMHLVGASKEKNLNDDNSEENEYWLNLGRAGLKYMDSKF